MFREIQTTVVLYERPFVKEIRTSFIMNESSYQVKYLHLKIKFLQENIFL